MTTVADDEPTFADLGERLGQADIPTLRAELSSIEAEERRLASRRSVVLGALDEAKVYRQDGHASMHGLLRSSLGWSEAECRSRMQLARLVKQFPETGECLHETMAPVANISAIARAHANPRCGVRIGEVIGTMLTEACRMEHHDFRLIPERWEMLADLDGAHKDRELSHDKRNAQVNTWQGITTCDAQWGNIDGAGNQEIFDRFVEAEFLADWEATTAKYGDKASKSLLPRTDAQRRADALTAIFDRAASAPPGSKAPEPVVNICVDYTTWCDLMALARLFPDRNFDPFESRGNLVSELNCETTSGELIDPYTVLRASLEGYVRFVILNDTRVPIHWGRKRRLFRGAARNAARMLGYRCLHAGCRVRAGRCQIDHTKEWHTGGETCPDNGGPECGRHNRWKHRHGYTVHRDPHGHWHTYRPDGSEVR